MSTWAITVSTSLRASHIGLPVSRAIVSAKASCFERTTLANRRSVSTRLASGRAAHSAQLSRARATSASTSLTGWRQSSAPVAGSVEMMSAIRLLGSFTLRMLLPDFTRLGHTRSAGERGAHLSYGDDLRVERPSVVEGADRGPDRHDLVDQDRT